MTLRGIRYVNAEYHSTVIDHTQYWQKQSNLFRVFTNFVDSVHASQ